MNDIDFDHRMHAARSMMDAVPGLLFVVQPDGTFVDCGGRDTGDLVAPPEAFIGKHVRDVLPSSVSDTILNAVTRTLATGQTVSFEYDLALSQGTQYFEARLSPATDGNVVCLVQNVTQRFLTTKELSRASALLAAVSSAQAAYIEGREPHDIFGDLLDKLLELTASEYGFIGEVHCDEDEVPYLKTFAITNIAWNEETKQFYDEHSKKGFEFRRLESLFGAVMTTRNVVISNDPPNDPRRCGLPPGHPPLKAFLGLPLLRGPRLVGMVGIANRPGGYDEAFVAGLSPFLATCANVMGAMRANVEREQYQSALARSEAHLSAVVESVSDGIIVFDERGTIRRINAAMQKIFNCSTEDTIGRKLSLFMSAAEGAVFDAELRRHLQRSRSTLLDKPYEFTGVREDGQRVPIELTVSELGPAFPNSFVGILRDITERKRIERIQSEFVSMVSHELRTPLTAIRGALGLLAGGVIGTLNVEMIELVKMAIANSDRLTRVIDDIIDVERIQSGELSVEPERVDMASVIRLAVNAMRDFADQHDVGLIVECDSSAFVHSDPHRLVQILSNLISNAIKYSPQDGTGDVVVTLGRTNGWTRVSVRDHGPGVPEQFKNRIFQRFAQADGADNRMRGGTGLGLSIAKAIIERLGGRIGYENVDTGGARFYFELPMLANSD